jgi:hypothetical protein
MNAVGGTVLIRRIAAASVLAVTLVATVLALTVWYYRSAILEAHDGVFTVESVEGAGTVFRVELPLIAVRHPVTA